MALEAASAASFQPLKAQISAGALSPSGRCSHCSGCIRLTVHHGDMALDDNTVVTVSGLRPGQDVRGVFACTRKDRLMTRNGSPYLALELRDRTGTLAARAFDNADALAGRFERGDLVSVEGRVERFREQLVVEVTAIARAEGHEVADPARFLPSAYRDLDELDGFLEHLAGEVYDRPYRELLQRLLGDRLLRDAWRRSPCTRTGHHAYLGGLLEHTVAVATLAHETCQLHPRLNSDLLLTAALTHDLGRTREFTYGAELGLTEEGRLLGHLVIGERIISEHGGSLDEPRRLALLHCVLCHHGPGSAPGGRLASAEALALYRINAVDAAIKGALEHGLGGGAQ
jgi:3'-5' exoribonuclease